MTCYAEEFTEIGTDNSMAKLYFYYASMNAGKSTLLLQSSHNYRERGMATMLFTAALDDRYTKGQITSRIGLTQAAVMFGPEDDLFKNINTQHQKTPLSCVFVDEAQFLTTVQVRALSDVVDVIGIPVISYGLRTDFQGQLFAGSAALLAWADDIQEVKTICHCGQKATMVARLDDHGTVVAQGTQVMIGGNDRYISLCRRHWKQRLGQLPKAPHKP